MGEDRREVFGGIWGGCKMKIKEKYTEKYVGFSPKDSAQLEDRHKKILKIFSKHKFDRILDVGCGDGNFSVLLKEACGAKDAYGIEISKKRVELANKKGVKAFQLDIDEDDFPFEDNSFDAVFAGEIIEHLFDSDHFLDEIYRVLNQKGIFVLTTPNLASLHNRIALLFGFQPFPINVSLKYSIGHFFEIFENQRKFELRGRKVVMSSDHVRVFTLRSLKVLLDIHGFIINDIKGFCAQLPENMHFYFLVRAIDKVLALFPSLSYRVIIVTKKEKK